MNLILFQSMMAAAALGAGLALPVSAQSSSPAFSASPEGSRAGKTAKMPVYPIPQKMTRSGGSVTVPALKLLGARDEPTVNALKSMFSLAPNGLPVQMTIIKGSKKPAGNVPRKAGAYSLSVTPQGIRMTGYDDEGLFYAAQTLLQLAEKTSSGVTVPEVEVLDWPDVPCRGTIEGFYGLPWGQEGRISQFKFYGKYKMNTYIYGPKDDVFHGFSKRWREPYPADMAKDLKELVKVAKQNKVNFVWAVHPGADIRWGEADRKAAVKKFEMMYDLGFRSFAVFFDDIGGEGAKPEGQVEFLNYLNKEFIHKKPDVTPLIVCPTAYYGGGSRYHEVMGEHLDKDIGIMWTGSSIVSDIRTPALKGINKYLKRPAFIWWNFPVTDYVRHALFLGRTYGVDADAMPFMQGFASNPMDKPEASKISLFSVANMTWNAKAYDSDRTWKDSIRILFPGCSSAMQTFADHNSDGGPSGHNYRKEESVEIAPVVEQVLELCRRGARVSGSKAFDRLKAEFAKIAQAPAAIRAKSNNPAFVAEVEPWLIQFESLGKAGVNSMRMIEATEVGNAAGALNHAMEAACLLAEMQRYSREISKAINKHVTEVTKKNSPWQTAVKPSELVMAPAVRELLDMGSTPVLSRVSGQAVGRVKPYVSTKSKIGIEKMLDDDPESFYYCKEVQKKGDFFGVDLGVPREIRTVSIVMGRNDSDTDAVNRGQLEVSLDGQSWSPLMPESSGLRVEYRGNGKKGRFVRYRATAQGVPGGKPDVWTAIRDFKVNAPAAPSVLTDAPAFRNAVVEAGDRDISLKRIMEVHPLPPKKSLGLQIPAGVSVESASVNLKTPDMKWAKLFISMDGKSWAEVPLKEDGSADIGGVIKGIRLLNASSSPQEVTLEEFRLNLANKGGKSADSGAAGDFNLATFLQVELSPERAEIPCDFPRAGSVIVLSDGKEASVLACGADGRWVPVGNLAKGRKVNTFSLKSVKKPVKTLGLTGKKGSSINIFEVIWK